MKLIQDNTEFKYNIYQSNLIIDNKQFFIDDCYESIQRFQHLFPNASSTWHYNKYNFFSLSSGSKLFYDLYKELKLVIRNYVGTDERLWFQSWINFHKENEVLNWHGHKDCSFHGFLSIDPKKSKTIFSDYEVENEIGNIYIGQSHLNDKELLHKVIVLEPYDGYRITIAFDVYNEFAFKNLIDKCGQKINLSIFPLL